MNQGIPEVVGHYWFFRHGFSKLPELVYVLDEPKNCAQTVQGLLKLESTDWFAIPVCPEIPEEQKEVA